MPKLCLLLLLLVSTTAFSQLKISGSVIDTSEKKPLENAVVSVLRPSDSVLVKFTRTKADGTFSIGGLPSYHNIILITYPNYADFADYTRDSSKSEINFGVIPLTPKSELLEAVIVKQQISAIKMKGDTLAFLADSFAVREGAAVDELLKKLPGITVNSKGEITAQGQKVNKVLVDGEEFFSDDPAVVIKNLQANAVKEVQVFDKKSDQAEFTGIDDGKRSKTINLTLKEDKKKGYYTKTTVGGGTNGTFNNDIMLNAFKGKRKIAGFGIMSNTGREDLDWQDSDRFGEGNNVQFDEESGGMYVNFQEDENLTNIGREEGLPKAWTAGLHFSNAWDEDRKKLNLNYKFNKNNQRANSETITQYILPDTQYFNTSEKKAFSSISRHYGKGIYDLKFDSLTSMKLTVMGNSIASENASRITGVALSADSGRVNDNDRLLNSTLDRNTLNVSLLWRKKYKVKGRTLSINFDQQARDQHSELFLNSQTRYYDANGNADSSELIDQKKNNKLSILGLKGNVVYTEPLSKILYLSVNYGFNYRKDESFRTALNKTGSNEYGKLDSALSNDFRFRYNVHSAGLDFKINKKKMSLTMGSGVNYSQFEQADLVKDTSRSYHFVNYFPKVALRFNPTQQRSLSFFYNGQNMQPTLEQLQPVSENNDPLNVRIGNPNLRQSFNHNFSLYFNDFKILNSRGVYLSTSATFMQHGISNATVTDAGGKTTYQAVNVEGNYNISFYGGYGWKVKKLNVDLYVNPEIQTGRFTNFVNNLKNINNTQAYKMSVGLYKGKQDKYFFNVGPNIGYTYLKSSLRPDVVTKYFMGGGRLELWSKLPAKFEVFTYISADIRQKTTVFDRNRNAVKWDANISRKFFPKNSLELKLSVFDLLNQQIGFNRTATSNIVTENSYDVLRRFFMFSVQYNFNKTP